MLVATAAAIIDSDSDDVTVVSATPPPQAAKSTSRPSAKRAKTKGLLLDSDGDEEDDFLPGKRSYKRR